MIEIGAAARFLNVGTHSSDSEYEITVNSFKWLFVVFYMKLLVVITYSYL